MQNEGGRWDPATVIGLKTSDRVLVVGNPAFLPWLTTFFDSDSYNVRGVRRPSEIEALLRAGEEFDKVILTRETSYSHDHLLRAGAFKAQLVYFPQDDGWSFQQSVEFYYPEAKTWQLDSTFGPLVIAEPRGASWRFYNA